MLSVAANVDLEQIQGIEVEPAEGPEDPGFGFRAKCPPPSEGNDSVRTRNPSFSALMRTSTTA